MKILHVYRTYFPDPPGGLQEAIRQISLATKNFGVTPTVFTLSEYPNPSKLVRPEGLVVRSRSWFELSSCNIGGFNSFLEFARLSKQVDLIHYHYPWPFADLLHLMVRPSVPAIMTYHSDIIKQQSYQWLYGPLRSWMIKNMKAIVNTSPSYAQSSPYLRKSESSNKIHYIPLGIEDYRNDGPVDYEVFTRLGLNPNQPYFLFIGVLRYYKGLDTLIRAAQQISVPIVIAGIGPQEEQLRNQVNVLGLTNVIFAGLVSDAEKNALLRACYALVLPSHLRSEAFGMVLVEAAMHAKPMISCEIGTGTSYINLDGVTGFVVPPQSPEELARAMRALLDNSILATQFGQAARTRYEALFSGNALGKAYSALYQEVLDSHKV